MCVWRKIRGSPPVENVKQCDLDGEQCRAAALAFGLSLCMFVIMFVLRDSGRGATPYIEQCICPPGIPVV